MPQPESESTPSRAPLAVHVPPPPSLTPSPYENTRPGVQYVQTERCVECHADRYASYLHSAHSRSMSKVDPAREPPDGVFDHRDSGRRYRAYRKEGRLWHRESLVLADGSELTLCDYPLKYLVGSGRFARTYLIEDAGFLVESPLTWYAALGAWAMSPGYDKPAHRAFHRTIDYSCLHCHAGALEPIDGNDERLALVETAIGCERCHGPGKLHTTAWSEGRGSIGPAGDPTIVNPKRLSRDLAEAICHQCHHSGEVQIPVRGRHVADFRPGLRWQDFAIDYQYKTAGSEMTVVGHVAQMHESRCYRASRTLTCVTCHDPHAAVEPAELVAHHRMACLSCHAEPSCGVTLPERTARNGNDCANCHMPQSPTDVPHVAFTHHRIGIHELPIAPREHDPDGFRPLAPMLDVARLPEADRRRALGLAYLQYHDSHAGEPHAPDYLAAARGLIEATAAQGLVDSCVAVAQAQLAIASGDIAGAERWGRRTLTAEDLSTHEKTAALRLLAVIALQQNSAAKAEHDLEELTALRREPRDWFLLGVSRQRQGNVEGAIRAWERVLEIDPAQPETYWLLAPLYRAQGNAAREQWCREQARKIESRK